MAAHEDFSRSQGVKASSNRGFGWVFVVVFVVIGLWPWLIGGAALRMWSLGIAAVVLAVTLLAPALLALPNKLWLRFGMILNRIMSPVVLGFMFYAVVTPMGWLMRLFGKDSLRTRDPGEVCGSYWIQRDPPGPKPDSLNEQF